jgi:hypothetical protein
MNHAVHALWTALCKKGGNGMDSAAEWFFVLQEAFATWQEARPRMSFLSAGFKTRVLRAAAAMHLQALDVRKRPTLPLQRIHGVILALGGFIHLWRPGRLGLEGFFEERRLIGLLLLGEVRLALAAVAFAACLEALDISLVHWITAGRFGERCHGLRYRGKTANIPNLGDTTSTKNAQWHCFHYQPQFRSE